MDKIKAIVKYPNKDAEIREIDNDYHELKDICDGVIDIVDMPGDENMCICCNDCFLYNGMEPNIALPEFDSILAGPLVFMGYEPESGDNISLTDSQVDYTLKYIDKYKTNNMDLIQAYNSMKVMKKVLEKEGVDIGE